MNTPGSFQCNCISGYTKNSAGDCVDVNECIATNPTVCKPTTERCFNIEGSYECKCADGYIDTDPSQDALSCVDIDECVATPNVCGNNSDCTNIPGSFSCRCKRGKYKVVYHDACAVAFVNLFETTSVFEDSLFTYFIPCIREME